VYNLFCKLNKILLQTATTLLLLWLGSGFRTSFFFQQIETASHFSLLVCFFLPSPNKTTPGMSPVCILGSYKTICPHIELAGNDATLIPEPHAWIHAFPWLNWNAQLTSGVPQLVGLHCLKTVKDQLHSIWCPLAKLFYDEPIPCCLSSCSTFVADELLVDK